MNVACRDILGHDIFYTPLGGTRRIVRVQGNYEDGEVAGGFSGAVEQQIELMFLKADVPVMPRKGDRITLPRIPGKTFEPINVQNDESGHHWLFNVKAVNG